MWSDQDEKIEKLSKVMCRIDVIEQMRDKVNQKVLKWFGYVEHISGKLLTGRVQESQVEEKMDRSRPCRSYLQSQKTCKCEVTGAKRCESDVHGWTIVERFSKWYK